MILETASRDATPTGSPATVFHLVVAESPEIDAQQREDVRDRGPERRNAPSTTFSASPRPSEEAAQNSPSAPPFATQPSSA